MNRKTLVLAGALLALAGALVGITLGFGLATNPAQANQTPAFQTQVAPPCTVTHTPTATPTGPDLPMMIGIGLIVITLGLLAVFAAQRRKTHFRP